MTSTVVFAALSEDLKRLNKCYIIFVGERIKTSDPLWKAVESGKKTGTDACMTVFDRGLLNTNGDVSKNDPDDPSNLVGSKVLDNFLRFQQSQFKIPDYSPLLEVPSKFTRDITDINETAYHVLFSIFSPKQKYSDVVKRDYGLRALRYSEATKRVLSINGDKLPSFLQGTPGGGTKPFNPKLVETGRLVGIVRNDIRNVISESMSTANLKLNDFNVNKHLGAGAIGSQTYLISNVGQEQFTDGGNKVFRRWSKNVMDDFLCRELPALRSIDVVNEVQTNSNITFKNGISCMGCHSTMDPLAGTIRNGTMAVHMWDDGPKIIFFSERTRTVGYSSMPTINPDPYFHMRPPNGRLFYRSYDGTIVKQEVTGLAELGEKLAATNDLYVCAAKRYYQFLTGINVDLSDIGSLGSREFSKGETFQRNKVIKLGLELKEHQSVRTMIKNIIDQKIFLFPDQGV